MADEPSIKINPAKKSELEFEVIIQGIDKINIPLVRFVISSEAESCDYCFRCTKIDDVQDMWLAKLPVLTHLKESTHKFHVEVIVDGYYFEPAQGTLLLVTDPSVKFQPTVSKPVVKTTFTVKQDEEPKKQEKPKEQKKDKGDEIVEAMGGGEITGQYAPTNDLLKKEMPPKQSTRKTAQAEVYDQDINKAELDDITNNFVPGEATDPPPQDDGKDDDENREEDLVRDMTFDPRKVAENIVRSTMGNIEKPKKQGTLFKRTASGKPIVEGWKNAEVEAEKAERAKKVKEILKS